ATSMRHKPAYAAVPNRYAKVLGNCSEWFHRQADECILLLARRPIGSLGLVVSERRSNERSISGRDNRGRGRVAGVGVCRRPSWGGGRKEAQEDTREETVDSAPYTGRPTGPSGSLAEQQRDPLGTAEGIGREAVSDGRCSC